ncbi:ribose-5-phosphate isomerase RpiA [Halovenus rubra]|uniref:Ribose-5-phosphate isomerase A n=2 Tax=Halovenus rubra TaxID=869890 RepID=A0ABD5XB88_9EURY|nr:ribose-5-phosphate isomerase RpiA [Halovenus rubra]
MKQGGSEREKRHAGESATQAVSDGMVVGLGTGSTAAFAIEMLGERVEAGLDIHGIPTSFQSRQLARDAGIPLTTLDVATPDVAIDGADQVVDDTLIKGGGAAHASEKIVDTAADRLIVVADPSKIAQALCHPVPVAVLPEARATVSARVKELDGTPELRDAASKDGPVVTDNGNLVLDCEFGTVSDPKKLATSLSAIPGVVEHGLFVGCADEIHIGTKEGVTVETL